MRHPEWGHATVRLAGINPALAGRNLTLDVLVTWRNVLHERVMGYIVRVPLEDGEHHRRVPLGDDCHFCDLEALASEGVTNQDIGVATIRVTE